MIDREKVIKGLEGIYRCISPVNHTCGDCPYQDNHVECIRRALSDAIALLKEQEAKKVICISDSIDGMEVGYCPSCDRAIVNKKIDETKFCRYCGQELKWK